MNTVLVYANLPHGQRFRLNDGHTVEIQGFPVSKLLDEHGNALPAGQYGVTRLPADQWAEVERLYGDMAVMRSGLIFEAPDAAYGNDMAKDHSHMRHGLEPVDPRSTTTRPAGLAREKETEAEAGTGRREVRRRNAVAV